MKEQHLGSNFDDFLAEEGLLAEAEAVALKRVIAFQIAQLMEEKKLSKAAMAKRMKTSRAVLDRLLDPSNKSATLHTLERAATTLGCELHVDHIKPRSKEGKTAMENLRTLCSACNLGKSAKVEEGTPSTTDIIDQLLASPLKVENFKPFTRERTHERDEK